MRAFRRRVLAAHDGLLLPIKPPAAPVPRILRWPRARAVVGGSTACARRASVRVHAPHDHRQKDSLES
ncbi:hypothetical protein SGM_6522 [Streptomyces griseoaurantiacus M045]|uniref:Uncharacterized protein n=1 Tax=Streptomyces griseoaurantiacus M045 TaxID=996637 RepID=F3NT29_9ACTN|nr:hypothetical protein SGM_6522 [Streptomyces griseoaurantiacus M045]